jgi:DNA-binding NarL/FixJ family response regulator
MSRGIQTSVTTTLDVFSAMPPLTPAMKTILIIEDEPQTRENLATILKMEGYRAITAVNGREGLVEVEKQRPDLVLCDMSMPELDGTGVLSALRANPATADLPFIFLTAKGERREQRHGMNLGADDYLAKPAMATELLGAIAARLARQEIRALNTGGTAKPFNPNYGATGVLERLGLTPREAEVASWVAQGKSNFEIATILGATESTIKKHLQNAFLKLGTENRNALTIRVLEVLQGA